MVERRTKSNVGIVMECDFSTTGLTERTVSQLALMDAMQPYFNYRLGCICGIPKINLTGTVDDWKKVRNPASGKFVTSSAIILLPHVGDSTVPGTPGLEQLEVVNCMGLRHESSQRLTLCTV